MRGNGLHLREIECGKAERALLCVDAGDPAMPAITIAAGVHGDEPAGSWALLELVETGALDPSFCYRIWPCVNAAGFIAGTRENARRVDVNRTFGGTGGSREASAVLATNRGLKFALSLDLHEDYDAVGFYCYEYGGGEIGRHVIAALEADGFAIDPLEATFDLAGPLDDAHCIRQRGRVVADAAHEVGMLGALSYSMAISREAARHALTFETPSVAPWPTRLAMHRTAVIAAIAMLAEESASVPFK